MHNDRDIEFIQFKRWLERLYADGVLRLDHKSCEMMADDQDFTTELGKIITMESMRQSA